MDKMPRPFGKKKKRPRGWTANNWKQKKTCSVCNNELEGAPSDPHNLASFLARHDQTSKCKPRHCDRCTCDNCFSTETLNTPSCHTCDNASEHSSESESTDAYSFSEFDWSDIENNFAHESAESEMEIDTTTNESETTMDTTQDSVFSNDLNDPEYIPGDSSLNDIDTEDETDPNWINANMNEFRIMNLGEVSKYISELTLHSATCQQAIELGMKGEAPIQLVGEVKNLGLASIIQSECKGCSKVFRFTTSPKVTMPDGNKRFEINVRAVWGQMGSGGGSTRLNEESATNGMPGLSPDTYRKIETEIGKWWHTVLKEEMLKAGAEEKKLAEEAGRFHEGVPAVKVIIDAGWSKSAHKHSYNAPGGVGIVAGAETKKLLAIGVKVKTCLICDKAANSGKEPKPHDCGKNWDQSSQAMEAQIFLEAFSEAEQVHGVRYMYLVGDGDSNTMPLLVSHGPHWCKEITKIECANHACKCLRSSLEKLVDNKPQYKGKGRLSKAKIVKITSGCRCAIRMRSREIATIGRKAAVQKLKKDIKNSVWHVSGHHQNCSPDFCKSRADIDKDKVSENKKASENQDCDGKDDDEEEEDEEEEEDLLAELAAMWRSISDDVELEASRYDCGTVDPLEGELLHDVSVLLSRLAEKADKLIDNTTSNLCENWMSIRNKFDGGKKKNLCGRLSWYWRCFGAGIRRNLGTDWSALTWERCTKIPASMPLWKFGKLRAQQLACSNKSHSKPEVQKRAKLKKLKFLQQSSSKSARKAYGPEADDVDIVEDVQPDELDSLCKDYYQKNVVISKTEAAKLERQTHLQSSSGVWREARRKRLTASSFGQVLRRRPNHTVEVLVRNLLYTSFKGNSHTKYGLDQEGPSVTDYQAKMLEETKTRLQVKRCGIFVSPDHPFLGASPDGIVVKDGKPIGLLEIKNVLKNKAVTFQQQAQNKKTKASFCLKLTDQNKLELKRTHEYYYQVQGQLNICDYPWADFIVRSTNPYQIHVERIEKDVQLWKEVMLPKLTAFYNRALLPELASPRHGKYPGIREPGIWVSIN